MSKILYAKPIVEQKIEFLKSEIQKLTAIPKLKVILVGENSSSLSYIKSKKNRALTVGAQFELVQLQANISEKDFLKVVSDHTQDNETHGIIIQLPLPSQLTHLDLTELIPAHKDVDGFHWKNLKEIYFNKITEQSLLPCTPKGILSLLKYYHISLESKKVCIIGRSFIVGKPLGLLLANANATVNLCHSKTIDLQQHTREADIIISAAGVPSLITSKHLRKEKNQILIDVGMNQDKQQKLVGDIDYTSCFDHCLAITPVPKGIGPMTVISLIENLIIAAKKQGL